MATAKRSLLREISLSNSTISRRINEISNDIKAQLLDGLNFAIQLDEGMDIASQAQLLVCVQFRWAEN